MVIFYMYKPDKRNHKRCSMFRFVGIRVTVFCNYSVQLMSNGNSCFTPAGGDESRLIITCYHYYDRCEYYSSADCFNVADVIPAMSKLL